MYNIKKAVSRLDFAPAIEQIKVTDVKRGLGQFTPKPDKTASFSALKATLKKAGYTLASAEITAAGTLGRDEKGWWIDVEPSGQRFALQGSGVEVSLSGATPGSRVEVTGDWRTLGEGNSAGEIINPRTGKGLWRGTAEQAIPQQAGGDWATPLRQAVAGVMKEFPPK